MFLTEANVLHYLADRHFGDLETVVAGGYAVRSLTRRNRNLHVTWGDREYLVKQSKNWDLGGRSSIDREAAFYRLREVEKPLPHFMPRCYAYDPPNSVLVLEFLSGYTDLYDAPDRFTPELGRLCGETMGSFHREMESGSLASAFPGSLPWFLSFHELSENLAELSPGQVELSRVVKRYPEFARALEGLRAEWRADTLIHGDWKLENCLVSPDRKSLQVVDWEFVKWGDSIWDVSLLLQSYWNLWVRWPEEFPVETIQPAVRAFLLAYARSRGWDLRDFAARAIRFAGARMLQAAYETLKEQEEMTAAAVRLMQGSLHTFTRPEWAAGLLIGAPLQKSTAHADPRGSDRSRDREKL